MRPRHTQQTLDALAKNKEAEDSILYIYCDGAKDNADTDVLLKIKETREIVRSEKRFKKVIINEHSSNKGLAGSIIEGVTEIINRHEKIIVLEDDIIPSPGFLRYMNDALDLYLNDDAVGCIHAWNYNLDTTYYPESTFFLKGGDCWGWATWQRSWKLFNPNTKVLLDKIIDAQLQYDFNRRGTHKFIEMLEGQIKGTIDSWAIRWHASLFIHNKYCLQPTKPIVENIGLDNSGIHCGVWNINQHPVDYIQVEKISIRESEWFFKEYCKLLKEEREPVRDFSIKKIISTLRGLFTN
ncbi:MAG: glycosyltransferase [Bacteroidota bacterium]|nr:glycosyltransferase [Bacteroidota bacterium]